MEGSKFFAKVKTPRNKSGIGESGGVSFSDATTDSLLHTNWDLLSEWVDKNMQYKDHFEKIDFISNVQQDPNWEYEDLEYAYWRELSGWENELSLAKKTDMPGHSNKDYITYIKNKIKKYGNRYPGDEAYRKILLERKRQKPIPKKKVKTEDKIMNGFLQQDNKYKMGK